MRKALIFHQADYEETRAVECPACQALDDVPSASGDKRIAVKVAHGFGIADKDITCIEDWPLARIEGLMDELKKEFRSLGRAGVPIFLFVYCAGHGVVDEFEAADAGHAYEQCLVLNGALNTLYPVERACR